MQKIGIFGGTFNPIHNGHLAIAAAAMQEYSLDKIIFLTSGNPPHKQGRRIPDGKIRHIMVKRSISGKDGFEACNWEILRSEPSYTYTTLMHFSEVYKGDEIYFIIGGDSLRDFDKWYKPEEILKLCTLLVYDRTGGRHSADFAKSISGARIDISSTEIREKVKNNEDISGLVPDSVRDFILRNNLYKPVDNFEQKLKTMLVPDRFRHSLGVRDTAVRLAKIYGADEKKAEIAGLLHDNAKNMPDMLKRCEDLEAELDEFELKNPVLIHAKLGAETAKCEFGITDREIIDAIRWHTIGRENMSLLEKIVFVADLTEPGRDFPDAPMLRELSERNLDEALLKCIRSTIEVNHKRGVDIHPNAYRMLKNLEERH